MKFELIAISALLAASAAAAEPGHPMDHKMGDDSAGRQMTAKSMCGMPLGQGVINRVDVKKSKVNVSLKAIDAIGWKEKTADLSTAKSVDLSAFAAGEQAHFLLKPQKNGDYAIAAICSLDAADGAHEACMKAMHDAAMKASDEAGKPCSMEDMGEMDHMGHDMKGHDMKGEGASEKQHDKHEGHGGR